jgi:PHP family Zn ribbon phosphoesterase
MWIVYQQIHVVVKYEQTRGRAEVSMLGKQIMHEILAFSWLVTPSVAFTPKKSNSDR